MPRKSTTVDDGLAEWIEEKATDTGQSESWVIRECIKAIRDESDRIAPPEEFTPDATDRTDPIRIDSYVADMDWPGDWGGDHKHRQVVRIAAWAVRDAQGGNVATNDLRDDVRREIDLEMGDDSLDKIIRVVGELPWVEKSGKYSKWVGED